MARGKKVTHSDDCNTSSRSKNQTTVPTVCVIGYFYLNLRIYSVSNLFLARLPGNPTGVRFSKINCCLT